jgi:hypothetical protein
VPFEGVVEPELEGVDQGAPTEEIDETASMVEDFIKEIKSCANKEKAKEIYKKYEKVANLSGDDETKKQLILAFTKVYKND